MGEREIITYAVDIGSEKNSRGKANFAWISDSGHHGIELENLAKRVLGDLCDNRKVSIGFECPLYFDIYDNIKKKVNSQRRVDSGRSWTASAGATATVTGMAQILWLLIHLVENREGVDFQILDSFDSLSKDADIFIWEAFVSKEAKSERKEDPHHADCKTALAEYQRLFRQRDPSNTKTSEGKVFSIIGALILRVFNDADAHLLETKPLVIKPDKPSYHVKGFNWNFKEV